MTPTHIPGTPQWLWWAYPWALALLLVLPALWWLWTRSQRRTVVRFSDVEALRAAAGALPRRAYAMLRVLRAAALACLIVAAARPQRPDESVQVFTEGVAIQMVIDTSTSMAELDMSPSRTQPKTRLDVVKDVFRRFVEGGDGLTGRKNDLIGIIRFARYADSVCPPTLDHDALMDVLDSIELVRSVNEDGTA
ncbi:MAG: VWA domain-containing protein, partial [Planctomycetota bacterium]